MHVSHRYFGKACTSTVVLAVRRRWWWRRRWRASRRRRATSSGATSSSRRSGSGSARRATASTSRCRWSAPAATGRALASLWTRFVVRSLYLRSVASLLTFDWSAALLQDLLLKIVSQEALRAEFLRCSRALWPRRSCAFTMRTSSIGRTAWWTGRALSGRPSPISRLAIALTVAEI